MIDNVYKRIKGLDSAYKIMKRTENLYKKENSGTLQEWLKNLYTLKSTKMKEIMQIQLKIIDILKMMERTPNNILVKMKNLKIMYNAFLLYGKLIINPTKDYNMNNLFEEIPLKYF